MPTCDVCQTYIADPARAAAHAYAHRFDRGPIALRKAAGPSSTSTVEIGSDVGKFLRAMGRGNLPPGQELAREVADGDGETASSVRKQSKSPCDCGDRDHHLLRKAEFDERFGAFRKQVLKILDPFRKQGGPVRDDDDDGDDDDGPPRVGYKPQAEEVVADMGKAARERPSYGLAADFVVDEPDFPRTIGHGNKVRCQQCGQFFLDRDAYDEHLLGHMARDLQATPGMPSQAGVSSRQPDPRHLDELQRRALALVEDVASKRGAVATVKAALVKSSAPESADLADARTRWRKLKSEIVVKGVRYD